MNNSTLFKNISLFTFFNLVNSAIPFLLLPILTVHLSPEDYGIVDIFYNISLLATPIIGLSVVQSVSRFYFEEVNLPKFITTVFFILLGFGLLVLLLSLLATVLGSDWLRAQGIPPFLIVFAIVYTLFSQIIEVLLILWRVSYKTVNYGVFRVAKTALDLGLSVLLIIVFNMGWEGRVIPQVAIAILFGGVATAILAKKGYLIGFVVKKQYKKEALSFSLPLIFHSLGGHIIGFSDRFFILFMLGLADVGIYSVGYQIGMVIALIQNSFNQAWVPFFYAQLKEGKMSEKRRIVKITYAYSVFLLVLVLCFYFLTPVIYEYFIGQSFEAGTIIVFWILLGYAFNGMYKMVVNYLFYLKKTNWIATATLGSAGLNLLLNYFLIKKMGIEGAAIATTITFFVLFVVITVLSIRNYEMPWINKSNP